MSRNISLCIIVKQTEEEVALLDKCLASVKPYVNEICLTADKEPLDSFKAVVGKYGAKFNVFNWCDDFTASRNENFKLATGDWILWLDCDDTLTNADKLKEIVDIAESKNISGLAFLYKYGFDKNGNCIDEHWKLQLVKNDGHFEWKGAIHEDILMKKSVVWSKCSDIVRSHNTGEEKTKESYERNLRILLKERDKNPKEPRTLFYLGRTAIAIGDFQKAVDYLIEYLSLSGWDEERYEANLLIGQAFLAPGNTKDALVWFNNAILEKEEYPDAYIMKGMAYLKDEDYKKGISNFENALLKNKPEANTYFNPMLYTRNLCSSLALCYLNVGRLEEARKYAKQASEYDNKSEEVKELNRMVNFVWEKDVLARKYIELAGMVEDKQTLLKSIPKSISDDIRILSLIYKYLPAHKWDDNSVAIYCGSSCEKWDGDSIKKGGIGGSETAVIEIAKRMVAKGFKVVVYNQCEADQDGKEIDGVLYRNYWEFNKNDEFNILWCWRLPELFDIDFKAKVKLLDLHDTNNPLELTPRRLENIDKIMVKTKYHRSLYPNVKDEKFEIIGNGINLDKFKKEVVKKPYKFIYASTPNRGLDIILEYMWDDIKKAIPEAEIHTFYGWNTFYQLEKHNPASMMWMNKCKKLMEKAGVINHGRVNQEELAKEELEASFWLYPTAFPEIHCITACEMQAAGVVPITSGYAALAETQRSGIKLEGDVYDPEYHKKFVDEVVKTYKSDFNKLSKEAVNCSKQFSWDIVADKWIKICQKELEKSKK